MARRDEQHLLVVVVDAVDGTALAGDRTSIEASRAVDPHDLVDADRVAARRSRP